MSYRLHPGCRICKHPDHKVVSDIDFRLLEGDTVNDILGAFGQFFGKADEKGQKIEPDLNYASVVNHRAHISKSIAPTLLGLPDANGHSTGALVKGSRAVGFESFIDELRKYKETLETLNRSASEDLLQSDEFLLKAASAKAQALLLGARDNIRKSQAALIKQIQEIITPSFNNVSGKDNPQFVELLMIFKKVIILTVRDKELRDAIHKELATQIQFSKELKWLAD